MGRLGESTLITKDPYPHSPGSLEKGLQYQDFVTAELYRRGIPIVGYTSKKYQIKYGENRAGVEIKFDDRMKETGNVYIETAEKANPANPYFVPSGIYRNDNSWLYAIGNYDVIYIFAKKTLCLLHGQAAKRGFKTTEIATSKGMLMPIAQ